MIRRGVGEGLKLSPVLFNIALGVVLKIMRETFEEVGPEIDKVRTTAFADDATLQSRKRSKIAVSIATFVSLTEPLGLCINESKSSFTAYFSGATFNIDTSDIIVDLNGRTLRFKHNPAALLLGYGLCYKTGICLSDHMITREKEKRHNQQYKDYKRLRYVFFGNNTIIADLIKQGYTATFYYGVNHLMRLEFAD